MKFPKNLYVKIDGHKGDEFFNATSELISLVTMGEKDKIATYQLVGIQEAEGVVETKRPRR